MLVTQVYNAVNEATAQFLGETTVLKEDLTNIVDVGEEVLSLNKEDFENFTRKLVDHIGKMVFVDRKYRGIGPNVMMDGWEYGSILEKVRTDLPEAVVNEDWELTDGGAYDPNVFHAPKVAVKFYNKRVCFEIDSSITRKQLKSAFSSATQMNSFLSMLFTAIENALTVKIDTLKLKLLSNFIGSTIKADYNGELTSSKSGVKAVNLLFLYNEENPQAHLTATEARTNADFLRFSARIMTDYVKNIGSYSTLFNIGGTDKFTPRDDLHVVLLSKYEDLVSFNMQSDTFHKELVELPLHETIPYWQGSGKGFAFDDVSKINVKTASGDDVEQNGIVGVMFDRQALGISNVDRTVATDYNAKGDFVNYFYKYFAGYFNDENENFVVFFIA